MAGISAFDIIGELKFLEEKGVIDAEERKKWEAKTVQEGVTDEIIEQMACFKRCEIGLRQRGGATDKTLTGTKTAPRNEHDNPDDGSGSASVASSGFSVSEAILDLRQLRNEGIIDAALCREWETTIIRRGIDKSVIEKIQLLKNKGTSNPEDTSRESITDEIAKDILEKNQTSSAYNPPERFNLGKWLDMPNASNIGKTALALGAVSLFLPYIVTIYLVPISLVLGVISLNKKENIGKLAVVLSVIGLIWIFYVSSQISSIMGEPFSSNPLNSYSSSSSFPSSSQVQQVTMSKYLRVREGMTYEEVSRIIGT